jgi:hypothetical protein
MNSTLARSHRLKNLIHLEARGIFFLGRLLNKPHRKQSDNVINYDETEYLQAMKRFQVKTRGMLKDSPEYTQVRNSIYSELRRSKSKESDRERESLGG